MNAIIVEKSPVLNDVEPLRGLATLMTKAFRGEDLTPLGNDLIAYAEHHPNASSALLDLSIVLQLKGIHDVALGVQGEALKQQQCYRLPTKGRPALRLLAIMGPGELGENTPLEFLVADSDIELNMLYVAPWLPFPEYLPEHDVVFVSLSALERNQATLALIDNLVKLWPDPVLNLPARIARLTRDNVSTTLKAAPGMYAPTTVRVSRQTLVRIALGDLPLSDVLCDGAFPIIVRPLDSHAGKGLAKVDNPARIADYLSETHDSEFYMANYVDYRSADGLFRKYRVVLIDGHPYASHMAISDHWMIHYLNGGMTESTEKRAEEERFMVTFDDDFALRHAEALRCIATRTDLDYLVIDCAEMPDGTLLVFEVDNTAVVHAMDSVDVFPYKQPQMRKIFEAFRAMLVKAKGGGSMQTHGAGQ